MLKKVAQISAFERVKYAAELVMTTSTTRLQRHLRGRGRKRSKPNENNELPVVILLGVHLEPAQPQFRTRNEHTTTAHKQEQRERGLQQAKTRTIGLGAQNAVVVIEHQHHNNDDRAARRENCEQDNEQRLEFLVFGAVAREARV